MTRFVMVLGLAATAVVCSDDRIVAQTVPTQDHFESRRRDAQYRENLRRQQARANQRVVPTFTIPQPVYNNPYHYGNYGNFDPRFDQRFDPRFDRRYDRRNYVWIPDHYQNVYGRLVFVPGHYQYVPR